MNEKTGRNDPCPCGSGKKYKQCCLGKKEKPLKHRPLKAVWVNKPVEHLNLIERTYGQAIAASSDKPPQPAPNPPLETEEKS